MNCKKEILKVDRKKKIYNYIQNHPGLHERELSRRLNMPKSSLKYHIHTLIKQQLIISENDGRYSRYYIYNGTSNRDKEIINIFRDETSRHIILYLLLSIVGSRVELYEHLEKDNKTLTTHIKKLLKLGIIELAPVNNGIIIRKNNKGIIKRYQQNNEKIYQLKDSEKIYNLLISQRDSLKDKNIDFILKLIREAKKDKAKKVANCRFQVDRALYAVNEIFPHPYHP